MLLQNEPAPSTPELRPLARPIANPRVTARFMPNMKMAVNMNCDISDTVLPAFAITPYTGMFPVMSPSSELDRMLLMAGEPSPLTLKPELLLDRLSNADAGMLVRE